MKVLFLLFLINIAWAQIDELYIIAGSASQTRYPYISNVMYDSFKNNPGISAIALANPTVPQEWVQDTAGNWSQQTKDDWDHSTDSERTFTQEEIDALWNFGPPLIKITEASQVNEALKSSKPSSTSRNPLIFINNHGGAPRDQDDEDISISRDTDTGIAPESNTSIDERMSATVSMSDHNESFDMEQLHDMIKDRFDNNDLVRIVGIQCFSGGIHEIAFRERNTCTAASTDWLTVTSSYMSRNKYGEGVANEKAADADDKKFDLNEDGQTSLQEAHIAGVANDELNWGRGQLSSMAYVDMILEEGAYADIVSREYYNPDDDPALNIFNPIDCISCTPTMSMPNSIDFFLLSARDIANRLRQGLFVPEIHKLSFSEQRRLPESLRQNYKELLKNQHFKQEQSLVRSQVNAHQITYNGKEEEISGIKKIINTSGLPAPVKIHYQEKLEEAEEELSDIQQGIERLITPLRGMINYISHLRKVSRFMKTATRSQKRKFEQLIECEMEPL